MIGHDGFSSLCEFAGRAKPIMMAMNEVRKKTGPREGPGFSMPVWGTGIFRGEQAVHRLTLGGNTRCNSEP